MEYLKVYIRNALLSMRKVNYAFAGGRQIGVF